MSVKKKIILWFSSILVAVVVVTFFTIISVGKSIIIKNLKTSLEEMVDKNSNNIEYYYILSEENEDIYNQYISYKDGFLEITSDFLDNSNGISSGIYHESGELIYGENPIGRSLDKVPFLNSSIQTLSDSGEKYFVFDRKLDGIGIEGLWLRGTISESTGNEELNRIGNISFFILCIIVYLGIVVGIIIIERIMKPVKKITDAAIKIGNGNDLKARINMGDGKDDFKILANQFDKMVDRLDKAFEKEKRFTSDASHELRTPVAVISAQCEYTLESPREIDEYIESLEVISRQTQRMSSLINDMLYLSRFENKKGKYKFEDFDFSLCISQLCKDMSLIDQKNITLYHDIEENITIKGERELLERLVSNLISNAYKYGKENGEIKVSLSRDLQNGKIKLSVADNGIGISEEEKEKIFDRFYRSDKSRSEAGTGLGLSLALEIAKLHGGDIIIESELDKGSTFIVLL